MSLPAEGVGGHRGAGSQGLEAGGPPGPGTRSVRCGVFLSIWVYFEEIQGRVGIPVDRRAGRSSGSTPVRSRRAWRGGPRWSGGWAAGWRSLPEAAAAALAGWEGQAAALGRSRSRSCQVRSGLGPGCSLGPGPAFLAGCEGVCGPRPPGPRSQAEGCLRWSSADGTGPGGACLRLEVLGARVRDEARCPGRGGGPRPRGCSCVPAGLPGRESQSRPLPPTVWGPRLLGPGLEAWSVRTWGPE